MAMAVNRNGRSNFPMDPCDRTQCQFSIFCRWRSLQLLDRPRPIRIRLGFAIDLHFSRRIHSLLLGPEADKIDITGRYVLWCIGN